MIKFSFSRIDYPHKHNEKQDELMKARIEAYNKIPGCRVGDWIKRKDGTISRATYDWGETIQDGGGEHRQFYIGEGYLSYSGGLNPGIEKTKLKGTGEYKRGEVWFFIDDYWGAGRGIYYTAQFRVFKEIDDEHKSGGAVTPLASIFQDKE